VAHSSRSDWTPRFFLARLPNYWLLSCYWVPLIITYYYIISPNSYIYITHHISHIIYHTLHTSHITQPQPPQQHRRSLGSNPGRLRGSPARYRMSHQMSIEYISIFDTYSQCSCTLYVALSTILFYF
jgi:hypothetical protein